MNDKPRVLIVGPGERTLGGISGVIRAYTQSPMWKQYNCCWLDIYRDGSLAQKVLTAARAYVLAPALILRSDIIHIHTAGGTSLLSKFPLFLYAKLLRKKVICHIHTADPIRAFRGLIKAPASKVMLRGATKVVALSQFELVESQQSIKTNGVFSHWKTCTCY